MARGIDRRVSVRDARERADVVGRRVVDQAHPAVRTVAVTSRCLTTTHLATALGVTPMAILRGLDRGREALRARDLDPDRLAREVLPTK